MCGILGVVACRERIHSSRLSAAAGLLSHRGPDGTGQWSATLGSASVRLAHCRLSIIDLTTAGAQPMLCLDSGVTGPTRTGSEAARVAITYNGEIYNYVELREELRTLGHRFTSSGDTEVLLAAYVQWGDAFLARLNGMFAFAIWDATRARLFCARDRFGEKPFYFVHDSSRSTFAFASEIKALVAMGAVDPELEERALYRYFAFGEQAGVPGTIWRGVHRLLAGHALEVRLDGAELSVSSYKYWDVDPNDTLEVSEDVALEQFRDLFRSSVQLRLRADVPLGTSLSGGLDSTSVLCQIKALGAARGQKAFTARMADQALDESAIVAALLRDVGIPGYTVTPTAEAFLEHADRMFYYQEEPFPSTSMFASYLVQQLARDHDVTVMLDGQGADEYLAGYAHYPALVLTSLAERGRFVAWAVERRALRARLDVDPVPPRAALRRWLATAMSGPGRVLVDRIRDTAHLSADFRAEFANEEPRTVPVGASTLKTRLYADLLLGHLQELLRYTDRNSMAFSREIRLPFLDHRLVEFCLRLPDRLLYRHGESKWILRHALRGLVPSAVLDRRDKVGFTTPWAAWWAEPIAGANLRARLREAHGALARLFAPSVPAPGSAASLEVLGLASIQEALRRVAPPRRMAALG